jgi:hypothetical protein
MIRGPEKLPHIVIRPHNIQSSIDDGTWPLAVSNGKLWVLREMVELARVSIVLALSVSVSISSSLNRIRQGYQLAANWLSSKPGQGRWVTGSATPPDHLMSQTIPVISFPCGSLRPGTTHSPTALAMFKPW